MLIFTKFALFLLSKVLGNIFIVPAEKTSKFYSKLPETTAQGSIRVGSPGCCTPAPAQGCWRDTGSAPRPPLFGEPFSGHIEWDDFVLLLHRICCTRSIHLLTSLKVRKIYVHLALENQYTWATCQMWIARDSAQPALGCTNICSSNQKASVT